jgi:hypothetical protein
MQAKLSAPESLAAEGIASKGMTAAPDFGDGRADGARVLCRFR